MILDVKFRWSVEFVRYRKRNSEKARITDSAPVEVAAVAAAQAPLAFRMQGAERSVWEGQTIELRSYDGRLWQATAHSDYVNDEKVVKPLSIQELHERLAVDDKGGGTPFALPESYYDHSRSTTLADIGRCRFLDDTDELREAVVQQLQQLASDVLIVDGVVYEPAEEPVYVIRTYGHSDEYGDIEIKPVSSIDADMAPDRVFRADRPEDVLREVAGMNFRTPMTEIEPASRIEVIMPEHVTFRYAMLPRLEKLARRICDAMVSDLKKADLPFASTYIRLRDALDARDFAAVATLVTDELVPMCVADARRSGFRSWELGASRDLREEGLRFGELPEPSTEHLAMLAG